MGAIWSPILQENFSFTTILQQPGCGTITASWPSEGFFDTYDTSFVFWWLLAGKIYLSRGTTIFISILEICVPHHRSRYYPLNIPRRHWANVIWDMFLCFTSPDGAKQITFPPVRSFNRCTSTRGRVNFTHKVPSSCDSSSLNTCYGSVVILARASAVLQRPSTTSKTFKSFRSHFYLNCCFLIFWCSLKNWCALKIGGSWSLFYAAQRYIIYFLDVVEGVSRVNIGCFSDSAVDWYNIFLYTSRRYIPPVVYSEEVK